jgi:prepilin-type processing-associated H-X9-DG protein
MDALTRAAIAAGNCIPKALLPRSRPWRFTLRRLFVGFLLLSVFLAVFAYLRTRAQERVRAEAAGRLRRIYLALQNYDDVHQEFPPRYFVDPLGKRLSSWRFALGEFYDEQYRGHGPGIDEHWQQITAKGGDANWLFSGNWDSAMTSFVAVAGPDTAFTSIATVQGQGIALDRPNLSLHQLPHDLILMVEVRDSGIHWMEPRDPELQTMTPGINTDPVRGISSPHPGGAHVLFADGTVWFLHNDAPFEHVRKFFTVPGAKQHDRGELLGSFHD